ncbi:MAG: Uma2 family endonuclease [Scytonematopsis contorta HA4267-MV1]|jgi:Uma2 family endonuclease|nr:Uma2 family endonuclease [Scytonematopsis contorta HA4267-MV1]
MTASIEQGIDKITHIPPLENGDRLTRHEFERRYAGMPHIKKAELIEGIVYMASPVRHKSHGRPHAAIIAWLSAYWLATPGVELSDNATVKLDADNEPQPDVLLRIQSGGSSRISEDDYIEGSPELIVEIAATSAANDLYDKKKVYRRNGVKEYIVWQTLENQINCFCLQDGEYILLESDASGVIKSQFYPGLWLDVSALKAGNMSKVAAVLQQGLNSSEHKTFVQQLAQD